MNDNQKRHDALIRFLQQFDLYRNAKIIPTQRNIGDLVDVDTNDINMAVFLICDFLNQPTGSGVDMNLYELLQGYLKKPELRNRINEIVLHRHA